MADEATLLIETHQPILMTVADGTGIAKGAILKLTDKMTAIINSGANDAVAGVAAAEKIANDGVTTIPVYRQGVFKFTGAAAISAGDAIGVSATANRLQVTTAASVSSAVLGCALEDCGGNAETFIGELRPGFNNAAYA